MGFKKTGFAARLLCMFLALVMAQQAFAANVSDDKPRVQVGILMFDGVQIIDFAGPYEVFGQAGFNVVTISHNGAPVNTAMGLKVTPDHSFANAPALDVLLVPGGEVNEAKDDAAIQRFVRDRSASASKVLSVCTGSFILASSGVLDGLTATTFHNALRSFEATYPKVKVVRDVRWTDNGKVVTSAGLSSGIDAALHLVSSIRGENAARSAALLLEYDWKPESGFVRTRMADRYMPEFKPATPWPADMKTRNLLALGDEHHWQRQIEVRTAMKPDAMLKALAQSVDALGTWKRTHGAGYAWVQDTEGKRVNLTVAAPAGKVTEAGFDLDITIDVR